MRVFQKILLVMICFVVLIGFGISNNAFAQCSSDKYIWTDDDEGLNPLAETGNYDPCDNWLHWSFQFDRNGNTSGRTIIQYRIIQASFYISADSEDYDPYETHYLSGSEYVGASNEHNLEIRRVYGVGGHFKDIEATASYKANAGI